MSHLILIYQIDTNFICERIASVSFTYYLIIDKMYTRVAVTREKRRPLQDCFRNLFLKTFSQSLQFTEKSAVYLFWIVFHYFGWKIHTITFAFVLCDPTAAAVQYWLETTEHFMQDFNNNKQDTNWKSKITTVKWNIFNDMQSMTSDFDK